MIPQFDSHVPVHGVGAGVAAGAAPDGEVDEEGIGLEHPAVRSPITMTTIIRTVPYLMHMHRCNRDFTREMAICPLGHASYINYDMDRERENRIYRQPPINKLITVRNQLY